MLGNRAFVLCACVFLVSQASEERAAFCQSVAWTPPAPGGAGSTSIWQEDQGVGDETDLVPRRVLTASKPTPPTLVGSPSLTRLGLWERAALRAKPRRQAEGPGHTGFGHGPQSRVRLELGHPLFSVSSQIR